MKVSSEENGSQIEIKEGMERIVDQSKQVKDVYIAHAEEQAVLATELTPSIPNLTDPNEIEKNLIESHDNFLFDCDGVLWRGGHLLSNIKEALGSLRRKGKRIFFVTNNSSKSRQEYMKKFEALGIEASIEEMIPSSFAAAEYLRLESHCREVKKVFVVGSEGLKDEIRNNGNNLEVYGGQDKEWSHAVMESIDKDFNSMALDETMINNGAVVCGWDLTFNFVKMAHASLCLQKMKQPLFIATNQDAFDRLEDRDVPGNGAAVASIEYSLGGKVSPITVGKPSSWLIEYILSSHNLVRERTVMIGDRIDTDVMLGNVGKCTSILVFTGCTEKEDLVSITSKNSLNERGIDLPTFYLSDVGKLLGAG